MKRPKHAGAVTKPICRKLLTIEQAADFAGVAVHDIRYWIMIRKLEAYYLAGGRVRIDEIELADCISSSESKQP